MKELAFSMDKFERSIMSLKLMDHLFLMAVNSDFVWPDGQFDRMELSTCTGKIYSFIGDEDVTNKVSSHLMAKVLMPNWRTANLAKDLGITSVCRAHYVHEMYIRGYVVGSDGVAINKDLYENYALYQIAKALGEQQ